MTDIFTPEEEILARGEADWVDFAEAFGLIRRWAAREDLDLRAEVQRVLAMLIESGWMVPGDVVQDRGFIPWPARASDSVAEVIKRWDSLGREPLPGDICWLQNTPEGDRRGRQALAEHGPSKRWIGES